MADGYRRCPHGRQQPAAPPSHMARRPRSENVYEHLWNCFCFLEMPSGHDSSTYRARENVGSGQRIIHLTDTINALYERYLRGLSSSHGGEAGKSTSGGSGRRYHAEDDLQVVAMWVSDPAVATESPSIGSSRRPENRLPSDASDTLLVECLPADCMHQQRDIFCPYPGCKQVRLVTREPARPGGDLLVVCFVDFDTPAHAARAMVGLQGIGEPVRAKT